MSELPAELRAAIDTVLEGRGRGQGGPANTGG